MAKTSKTVKRAATSSSSKGSVGKNSTVKKKGFLGRSFNLQSRKVQFFVVILIVAILGGGYFTYKSFAANASYYYPGASAGLTTRHWTTNLTKTCTTSTIPKPGDSSKNPAKVFNIACPSGAQEFVEIKKQPISSSSAYRLCASIQGAGSVYVRLQLSTPKSNSDTYYQNSGGGHWMNIPNDNVYHDYCTEKSGTGFTTLESGWIVIGQSSWVNVAHLRVEQMAPSETPPPIK